MKSLATGLVCAAVAMFLLGAGAEAGMNQGASIIIHTGAFSGKTTTCVALATAITGCVDGTVANVTTAAPHAFVAVYANQLPGNDPDPSSGNPGLHLAGIDFGINYEDYAGNVTVSWTKCADLELPTDGVNPEGNPSPLWPTPGSGNSLIWGTTQFGPLVLLGYFDVNYLTYGPVLFAIVDHPQNPARMLDEYSIFDDMSRLGAAGLGGATGSNSCPVAARPTSWGNIKSLYGR